MAEFNVTQMQLTHCQVGCVLNDIASTANAMERFAVMLEDSDDERDSEALRVGIRGMAQRIGLLADSAADRVPQTLGATLGTTADKWMMPPLFFSDTIGASE